jgi:hypothetical protein
LFVCFSKSTKFTKIMGTSQDRIETAMAALKQHVCGLTSWRSGGGDGALEVDAKGEPPPPLHSSLIKKGIRFKLQ